MFQTFFSWYDCTSATTIGHAIQTVRKVAERNSFTRYAFHTIVTKIERLTGTTKDLTRAVDIAVRRYGIKHKMYAVGTWYDARGDAECHPNKIEVRKSCGGFLAVTSFKR